MRGSDGTEFPPTMYKEGLYINILLHLESLVVDSIVEGVYVLKYVGPVKTEEEASNQIFWNHK